MWTHLATGVALSMLLGLTPAHAGGDLPLPQVDFSPVYGVCPPPNQVPVPVVYQPGWVCLKARVTKTYWKRCETKTWYASSGTGFCTQRFFEPDGTFCADAKYKGKLMLKKFTKLDAVFDFSKAKRMSLVPGN